MYFAVGTPRILSERLAEPNDHFSRPTLNASDSADETLHRRYQTQGSDNASSSPHGGKDDPLTTILAIRKCPGTRLFASITFNVVSIWSIRPDIQLSKVVRSSDTVREDGENVDLVWKPDGSQLVVLTNEGFLHFYDIVELDTPLLEYHFRTAHHLANGPGENKSTTNRCLRFRMALEIDSGTQCGIGLDEDILICTNSPPSMLSLNWTGEVNIPGTVSLEDLDFFMDRNDRAREKEQHRWIGHCFYNDDGEGVPATSIDFNPKFTLIAVGTLHAATALSWTQDGYALAVAWLYGGMSVWSVYGSLLMSTISEDTFVHSADGIVNNTNELFFTGTQDLVTGFFYYTYESVSDIYVLQFAKASILTCDSWIPNVYIADNWPIKQSFAVQGGMLWFRTMLIVACQDVISYNSETTLDQRVQLHAQQAFSMQDIVSGWGDVIQAIARFPPPGDISIETMISNPFVVLRNGSLYMISKRGESWEGVKITGHTEHFWISAHEDEVKEFSSTMWALSGPRVKILTNIVIDPVKGVDNSFLDAALDICVDFYPLTVLIQKGLLVGIEKQLSLNATLDISQFSTDTKSHLFLHFIIRHLLSLGLEQRAITFCSNYQTLEYFSHALEVLLHTVLEDETESTKILDSNGVTYQKDTHIIDSRLAQTVKFIKRFPKSLEIIVNCARKSEMAIWEYFFSVAGDPIAMFQLAVQLLEKSFDLQDYETGSELVRFLKSIEAKTIISGQQISRSPSPEDTEQSAVAASLRRGRRSSSPLQLKPANRREQEMR
ncbi:hypothetical protein BSLG_004293 [Batrachochytrium salamandrivorans]|nr:hypothetical protein BSLG_004293 [Batrachochytrium salamandrivorans]